MPLDSNNKQSQTNKTLMQRFTFQRMGSIIYYAQLEEEKKQREGKWNKHILSNGNNWGT
jgi:hypothetical protein